MPTLHIMKGLPASGKTTFARELVAKGAVRVNRDDLRAMMHNGKWSRRNEPEIINAEKSIVRNCMSAGRDVVVDDTNLLHNIWESFVSPTGGKQRVHDFTHISPEECVQRDMARQTGRVGPAVIYRMAAQAGLLQFTGRPIVICDIDGTLADLRHRLHYVQQTPKDWDSFFARCDEDRVYHDVLDQVEELSKTHDIVFVSGRRGDAQTASATFEWLRQTGVQFVGLLMRRADDRRPDDQVKEELLRLLPRERVALVIDDRPRVIRMWQRNGLNVQQVHPELWEGKED